MKYFLDTEFIEGFHKPLFGKRRHHIDLISVGIVREDGNTYKAISSEYNWNDASDWVKKNVIAPLYVNTVHGDTRNQCGTSNFHKRFAGKPSSVIAAELLDFFGCWRAELFWRAPEGIEIYGFFADYDWVLFCSLFGTMMDLPKGFPMYCRDLKQMIDDRISPQEIRSIGYEKAVARFKEQPGYPQQSDEHDALADAQWNKALYHFLTRRADAKVGRK